MEIVKDRLYNPDKRGKEARVSAQYTLYNLLLGCIKLFAPIMPYITESVYQMYFAEKEKCKSVHISEWPKFDKKYYADKEARTKGDIILGIISTVRKKKSEANKSLKLEVKELVVECDEDISEAEADIKATTNSLVIKYGKGEIEAGEKIKIRLDM
jgi:valyl-tRNA synthetase